MRGIPHMVAIMNCQSTSNAWRRGNAKMIVRKWPTNNHVSGLTLSRQCVHKLSVQITNTAHPHTRRMTDTRFRVLSVCTQVSLVQYTYLLVSTAPTQRRALLKERGK